MTTETTIDVRGRKVFVRRAGRGEPLLFLHGAQGHASWPTALEALSKDFDVLAPDHPGFGKSDAAGDIDDVTDLAFFYMDFLDSLNLSRVHVVGQSIGGWIALELALRLATRLPSLTLASSAGIRMPGNPPADMHIIPQDELADMLFAGKLGEKWCAEWRSSPDSQATYIKNQVATARYSWQPRLYDPRLAKWLHRVTCPTHVVWGTADRIIPTEYAQAFRKAIPQAKVTILPNCGHLLHLEQPNEFAQHVGSFIKGVR